VRVHPTEKRKADRCFFLHGAVFKKPLALHSTQPMTGYMRNGYCEAPRSDQGNHSVAGA
jgi:uncharacterized protein (DUF2237 family)